MKEANQAKSLYGGGGGGWVINNNKGLFIGESRAVHTGFGSQRVLPTCYESWLIKGSKGFMEKYYLCKRA